MRSIASWIRCVPILAGCFASPAVAALVLNEVLYDPEGPDAGREFVEIANNGAFAVPLDGIALEAGDGARAGDWKIVWEGRAERWIPPGGFYRVGLDGPGDGEAAVLGLGNGPDAVRLSKQGFVLDRLGWGDLAHPEYYEGHPASAVRSGRSLARRADGVDTGDNAADFEEAVPSPGRPNRPGNDWALWFGRASPARPRPGDAIAVKLIVENRGRAPTPPPEVELLDRGRPIWMSWPGPVEPRAVAERTLLLAAPSDTGRSVWRARLLAGDEVPENDADSLRLRVGTGRVRITEILANPAPGGCEWIEIRATAPDGRLLSGLRLEAHGKGVALQDRRISGTTRIGVVVQDSVRMRAVHPELPPSAYWGYQGSWPTLRNGGRAGGVSDTILIRAPDGVVEEIALPGPAPAPGISLERLEADLPEGPDAWAPCGDRAGSTPGRADSSSAALPVSGELLAIRPRIVHPGTSVCLVEGAVGSAPADVTLEMWSLSGRLVRCLLRDLRAEGRVVASWDGRDDAARDVPPGVYVALLTVRRGDGGIIRSRAALAIAPGAAP